MQKSFIIFSLMSMIIGFWSCDTFDEEPMYIRISNPQFVTDPSAQGFATHRIQDVWVYVDGKSVGVYELPAIVPILSDDESVEVEIFAGIRNNGTAFAPAQYPFMEKIVKNYSYQPGEYKTLEPEFSYKEKVHFALIEDFEVETDFIDDLDGNPTSTLNLTSIPEEVAYGNSCGKIEISTENTLFQQATLEIFSAADFGSSQVYLEMDFKCEVPFVFGYVGIRQSVVSTQFPNILNRTDEWTKIYLDLSSELNGGTWDFFKLMIAGAPQDNAGSIWLDNIKLIYLKP